MKQDEKLATYHALLSEVQTARSMFISGDGHTSAERVAMRVHVADKKLAGFVKRNPMFIANRLATIDR